MQSRVQNLKLGHQEVKKKYLAGLDTETTQPKEMNPPKKTRRLEKILNGRYQRNAESTQKLSGTI